MVKQEVIKRVLAQSDANNLRKLDEKRADLFKEYLRATADLRGGAADVGAAFRLVLLNEPELFLEVAEMQEKRHGNSVMMRAYETLNTVVDGKRGFQRAIDAESGGGNDDFGGLFVEKTIKQRVESESKLLQFLDVKRQTEKKAKHPKSSNSAKAAFAAASADLTDLTATIDGGFGKTEVEAEKYGGTLFLEAEAMVKLDAQIISQIFDQLVMAHVRGMHDQIVNGNGTPPNALGFATNATSVTFDTNIVTTLVKMIATIADVSKGNTDQLFILTNTAAMIKLQAERYLDESYRNQIDKESVEMLLRIPAIQDNFAITTSGSSPNKAAPLYVGVKGDYLVSIQTDPKIEINKYGDFNAGGETVRIMNFWTGKPHWNDSFAKTTVPTIY